MRAQGQNEMAINLAKYISESFKSNEEAADVYRLVGKWLAETRSSKLVIDITYLPLALNLHTSTFDFQHGNFPVVPMTKATDGGKQGKYHHYLYP